MGRPRKSKGSSGKLQSITSLLKRSTSQYSNGYTGSESGSSDSGQMDDYGFLSSEQHLQREYGMKYNTSQVNCNNNGSMLIERGVEPMQQSTTSAMVTMNSNIVKEEPTDRFSSCQSDCSQWSGHPRDHHQWTTVDELKMKPQSSPPQGSLAVRKMEFEQPHPCSFTGLLAEASMPPTSVPQISTNTQVNQFNSATIGENVPSSYDAEELNEILAMLPPDGPINSHFLHQVQNELRSLAREAGYDPAQMATFSTNNKVILNTPTIPTTLRSDKLANHISHDNRSDLLRSDPTPTSLPVLVTPSSEQSHSTSTLASTRSDPQLNCSDEPPLLQPTGSTTALAPEHCSPPALPLNACPSTPLSNTHCSPIAIPQVHHSPSHAPQARFSPNHVAHISPIPALNKALMEIGDCSGVSLTLDKAAPPLVTSHENTSNGEDALDANDWSKYNTQFSSSPNWQANVSSEDSSIPKTIDTSNDYGSFPSLFVKQELPVK